MSDSKRPPFVERRKRRPLLEVERLSQVFSVKTSWLGEPHLVRAVDHVSLFIRHGETLAIVGESGAGKSALAKGIARLIEPTYGLVKFDGQELTRLDERALRQARRHLQMVFQDPAPMLEPTLTTTEAVLEPLEIHHVFASAAERLERARRVAERIGLPLDGRRPGALSAGEKQKLGLARSLVLDPKLLICDEPVSELDTTARADILTMLAEAQDEHQMSILLLTHDLSLVRRLAQRVAVMFLGRLVELATVHDLFTAPQHPYSQALLGAEPTLDAERRHLTVVSNIAPVDALAAPPGCAYHRTCPRAEPGRCDRDAPEFAEIDKATRHRVACWHPGG